MPTNTEIKANVDEFIIDPTSPQSVTRANVGGIIKSTVDYTDQEVAAIVQNNLLPSATKAASVDAVLAGLESVSDDVQSQIDAGIAGVYRDAGNWDASSGLFPEETNTGDPIEAGDLFTVDTAGTLGGVAYVAGESFRALVNTPGQTASNWKKLVYVAGAATTTTPGIVTIASDSDVSAGTGSGMVNSTQLQEKLDNFVPSTGYKEYKAYISQSGTSAPTATVVVNTLGGTVVWARSGAGAYTATLTNAFTTNKTFIPNRKFTYDMQGGESSAKNVQITRANASTVTVQTFADETAADVGLSNMSIEIQVYN